jgi:hypothetical protein
VCKTSRAGGRHEHPAGGAGVWAVTEEHPQNAAVFFAPGYARKKPVARPKLGPWLGIIDQILVDDQSQPKKQRHTAKRIFDRLKAEHAFGGCYTIVKDYVRQARLRHKEVFVPLAHPSGDAQADFGEALVVIAGVEQKAHFQCFELPQSDDCFVIAFPAENTETFLEGHNHALAYFGGVPRTILYDNTRIAVKEIAGDGERQPTKAFSGLQSHYVFAAYDVVDDQQRLTTLNLILARMRDHIADNAVKADLRKRILPRNVYTGEAETPRLLLRKKDQNFASSGEFVGDCERQRAVSLRNRRSIRQVASNDLC